MLDLSNALLACHQKNIMHRDLKPDNIIIRRRNPMDAVIGDFGLSFNEQEPKDLSKGDRIGNGFTELPERGTPDAQRHYESNITAICGIFYYCVTGHRPQPFRDATNGLAPHRRTQPGMSMREAMKGHPATSRLETLFDQAFEFRIQDRIGTVKEFVDRLSHARAATGGERKSLDDVLKEACSQIVSTSRKTQLHKYSEAADKVIRTCENELGKTRSSNRDFALNCIRPPTNLDFKIPDEMTFLGKAFALGVSVVGVNEASAVEYAFAARGNQTALLRRRIKIVPLPPQPLQTPQRPARRGGGGFGGGGIGGGGFLGGGFLPAGSSENPETAYLMQLMRNPVKPGEDWQVALWYQGEGQPNSDELMDEITKCVQMQIEELKERLR